MNIGHGMGWMLSAFLCLGFNFFHVVTKMHYGGQVLPSQLVSYYFSYICILQFNCGLVTTSKLVGFMVVRNPHSTKSSMWRRFYILFCITFDDIAFCWLCIVVILYFCINWNTCWFWLFFVCFFNMGVGVGRVCVVVGMILLGLGFKSPSSPFLEVGV